MLVIYDLSHNKVGSLSNYSDYYIERAKGELDKLYFTLNKTVPEYSLLKREGYIGTKDYGEYVIKEINESDGDTSTVDVVADLNIEDIQGHRCDSFESVEQTAEDTTNAALNGTGWSVGTSDVTRKRTVRKTYVSSFDVLKEIQSAFNCEMEYVTSTKKVNIWQSRGRDRGVYFAKDLNLKSLTVQGSTRNLITCLVPIGKDDLKITDVNNGSDYISNHQYLERDIYGYWSDNRYKIAQDLLDDANERLAYLSQPIISYSGTIVDLAKINTNYTILDYDYGDYITLINPTKDVKSVKERLVKVAIYPDEPTRNTCELANRVSSLTDLDVRFLGTSDTVDGVTTQTGNVDSSKVEVPANTDLGTETVQNLTAIIATIGTALLTKLTATDLEAINAYIENLKTGTADIKDLKAAIANIDELISANGIIVNLLSDKGTIGDLSTDTLTANYAALVHGVLGYAQIAHVDANVIDTGELHTALLSILGSEGRFKISDNTLQIFDGTDAQHLFERIAIGKIPVLDAAGNPIVVNGQTTYTYGFRVRGSDGVTVLYDQNGITKEGITTGWNAAADGSMDGKKLDIQTVVTAINNGTTTINGSKVLVDNKTLDVALSEKVSPADLNGSGRNYALATATPFSFTGTGSSNQTTHPYSCSRGFLGESAITVSFDVISTGSGGTLTAQFNGYPTYDIGPQTPCVPSTTLQHYSCTAKNISSDTSPSTPIIIGIRVNDHTGTLTVSNFKLEIGSVATGWSPAPEDIQQQFSDQEAEITANAQGISTKVSSSTYTSAMTKANSDISDLQTSLNGANTDISNTKSSISDLQSQVDDKASKDDLNSAVQTLNQSVTQLKQSSSDVSATISQMYQGGTNRIKNSSGLNSLSGWTPTGTILIDSVAGGAISSGKCFRLSGNSELDATASIYVAAHKTYTMTVKVKKDTANSASKILLIDNTTSIVNTFSIVNTQDILTDWTTFSFTFEPSGTGLLLKISNLSGQFWVADMMLAEGPIRSNWTPAFNELYIDVVKIDSSGVTVSDNDSAGMSTHISPSDVTILHQGQAVAVFNSDITQLQALNVVKTLQISNVQMIPRPDGSGYLDVAYLG